MARICLGGLIFCAALLLGAQAEGQGKFGEAAPDFPPGVFTDGNQYRLSDFKGKVVVLYFYEANCPTCKGKIPEYNALVKAMQGKPVKFIAVGTGDSSGEAAAYAAQTKMVMPIFADSLGLMEKRYGMEISLKNIYQFRIIDPEGKVVSYIGGAEEIDKALAKTKSPWKYKGEKYDAKLDPILDLFEWGQYAQGMKLLTPARKSISKALAAEANKLYDVLKKEGEEWKAEAEEVAEAEPIKAYDLYTKIATVFAGEPLGKSVAEPLKKLTANKAVSAELAARKAYSIIDATLSKTPAAQKAAAVKFCQDIAKKYAGTPTAEKAAALAKEIGG